ncbi:MAG: hypothetical protein QG670_2749 [Thermoproteota archaeon]|nr:hypothetical protein [Thermoproteota archaeon]
MSKQKVRSYKVWFILTLFIAVFELGCIINPSLLAAVSFYVGLAGAGVVGFFIGSWWGELIIVGGVGIILFVTYIKLSKRVKNKTLDNVAADSKRLGLFPNLRSRFVNQETVNVPAEDVPTMPPEEQQKKD